MFLIIQSVSCPSLEEILYTAMEDFATDIVFGEGQPARSMKISLPKFTLIGTTTRLGFISSPSRDRFNIPLSFQFYRMEDISKIVLNVSQKLNTKIDQDGTEEIAKRARATPRTAIRHFSKELDILLRIKQMIKR